MDEMTSVAVSARALQKRINRRLAPTCQKIFKSRGLYPQGQGPYYDQNFGKYYILDIFRNNLIAGHVDLEKCGRELGVLHADEGVVDAE